MSQPANYWKLGLLVTLAFLGAIAILGWIGTQRLERESIKSHYFFDEQVNGLELGSPVKFRGVPIGKVVTIRVAPDQRRVEVIAEIYVDALDRIGLNRETGGPGDGPFVPDDLRVQLIQNLLTGTSFVQGDFFDPETHPIPDYGFEVPWETVHTVASAGKGLSEGLPELMTKIPAMLDDFSRTLKSLEDAVEEAEVGATTAELRAMTSSLRQRVDSIDRLEIITQGKQTLASIESTMTRAGSALEGFEGLVSDLREEARFGETTQSVRHMSGSAASAADEIALLSRSVRDSLARWDETMSALQRVADLLERDPSALIHGREWRRPPSPAGR